mgnify:CR=1 FL=1
MIKFLYGNEPYLIARTKEELVSSLSMPEMNLFCSNSWNGEIREALATLPFVDDKRVVVLDLDRPSSLDCESFKEYLKKPSATSDLLIILREVDFRTKFCSELKKSGLITMCDKFKDEGTLTREIGLYLKQQGASMDKDALSIFICRENYFEVPEVNFFNIKNDLDMLISINKSISKGMVEQFVPDNATVNDFALAKLIASKDVVAVRKHINMVPESDTMRILALLLREYRIAFKALYFNESEIGVRFVSLKGKLSKTQLLNSIRICTDAMEDIKSGKLSCSYALKVVTGKLLAL